MFKIPRQRGKVYTYDMVSKELCEVHEAFQHLKKKWVEQQIVEPVKYN